MYILKVGIVLLLSLTVLCEEYEDAFEEYADQFKNIIVHEDYGLDIVSIYKIYYYENNIDNIYEHIPIS